MNIKISQHTLSSGEEANLSPDKPLCFLLDERKNQDDDAGGNKKKKKKKEKKDGPAPPTFKNFGSFVNVSKMKNAGKLTIGWRVRHRVIF